MRVTCVLVLRPPTKRSPDLIGLLLLVFEREEEEEGRRRKQTGLERYELYEGEARTEARAREE